MRGEDPRRARVATAAAEALAREAVALVEPTDLLSHHGDAMLDLADVLRLSGRTGEAGGAACDALALYERKGNLVSAQRARLRLASGRAANPRRSTVQLSQFDKHAILDEAGK